MLEQINLEDLVIFDIETAPLVGEYAELPEDYQKLWEDKYGKRREEGVEADAYFFDQAGIYAEFGRVVCISLGFFHYSSNGQSFRVRNICDPEESFVLQDFAQLLEKHYADTNRYYLCGHNIKGFDLPYLCRRMLVNGMKLPGQLNFVGKKPWEIKHLDTMELWRFGDHRNFTSLKLLAQLFGIPTPKDDIDGSEVGRVFWEDNDLDRIATYCAKDVVAVAQLLLRLQGKKLLEDEQIVVV